MSIFDDNSQNRVPKLTKESVVIASIGMMPMCPKAKNYFKKHFIYDKDCTIVNGEIFVDGAKIEHSKTSSKNLKTIKILLEKELKDLLDISSHTVEKVEEELQNELIQLPQTARFLMLTLLRSDSSIENFVRVLSQEIENRDSIIRLVTALSYLRIIENI
jgi:hypothetical protein